MKTPFIVRMTLDASHPDYIYFHYIDVGCKVCGVPPPNYKNIPLN